MKEILYVLRSAKSKCFYLKTIRDFNAEDNYFSDARQFSSKEEALALANYLRITGKDYKVVEVTFNEIDADKNEN